jgi:hypothetical protein
VYGLLEASTTEIKDTGKSSHSQDGAAKEGIELHVAMGDKSLGAALPLCQTAHCDCQRQRLLHRTRKQRPYLQSRLAATARRAAHHLLAPNVNDPDVPASGDGGVA